MKDQILSRLLPARVNTVRKSYLDFEINHINEESFEKIKRIYNSRQKVENLGNSALLYCLGLTDNYDPKKKCLYLVTGSGPDIDTDFAPSGFVSLLRKVQEYYGEDSIARIGTSTPWSLKDSVVRFTKVLPLRDKEGTAIMVPLMKGNEQVKDENGKLLETFLYGSYIDGETITAKIPDSFRGRYTKWKDLKEDELYRPLIKEHEEVFNYAGAMDGQPMHFGVHACGVVIYPPGLANKLPLRRVADSKKDQTAGVNITQFDGPELEKLGLVKYDFLSIANLDINQDTCRRIGKDLNWLESRPLDDPKVFETLNEGFTVGIFQIEEGHIIDVIQKAPITSLQDISAISALIRPGPKDAGLTKDFIEWKSTGVPQNKLHPALDEVLAETGGVLCYQEQVMQTCQVLAGMSLAMADEVRRAMGKKKPEEMAKYSAVFTQGFQDIHKVSPEEAQRVWEVIAGYADYGFNKSHSIAYALISYDGAYLKTYHPVEFMATVLSYRTDSPNDFRKAIRECQEMGITILPPEINHSGLGFTVNKRNILFGLDAIRGLGEGAAEEIIKQREEKSYSSIIDFIQRVDRTRINRAVTTALVWVGAFDSFGYNRDALVKIIPEIYDFFDNKELYLASIEAVRVRDEEILAWESEFAVWEALNKEKKVTKETVLMVDPETGKQSKTIVYDPPRPKKPIKKQVRPEPVLPSLESAKGNGKITLEAILQEGHYLKYYATAHPLDFINPPGKINHIEDIKPNPKDKLRILAVVTSLEKKKIKSGKSRGMTMGVIGIQDKTGNASITIFPSVWEQIEKQGITMKEGLILYLTTRWSKTIGPINELVLIGEPIVLN